MSSFFCRLVAGRWLGREGGGGERVEAAAISDYKLPTAQGQRICHTSFILDYHNRIVILLGIKNTLRHDCALRGEVTWGMRSSCAQVLVPRGCKKWIASCFNFSLPVRFPGGNYPRVTRLPHTWGLYSSLFYPRLIVMSSIRQSLDKLDNSSMFCGEFLKPSPECWLCNSQDLCFGLYNKTSYCNQLYYLTCS